jgi:glycosyltransferase involved in cell wall biosynthesis
LDASPAHPTPKLAVAIPCYNEAAAIEAVVRSWQRALPDGEIVVFDNNSTDGTGDIARASGVRVVLVPDQGKGYAVRAVFRELADRDAVILVDGDGTYPASECRALIGPILDGSADMSVGARRPVDGGAMSPVRGLGNALIRFAFRVLIGKGPGDLLSGYRAFSRDFVRSTSIRSTGFEIETEIAGAAVARGLRTVEVPVAYYPRIAGTESKLRAFRDGRRILLTIILLAARLRRLRLAVISAAVIASLAAIAWWILR